MVTLILYMACGDVVDYGVFSTEDAAREHARMLIVRWCEEAGGVEDVPDYLAWAKSAPAVAVIAEYEEWGDEHFVIAPVTMPTAEDFFAAFKACRPLTGRHAAN